MLPIIEAIDRNLILQELTSEKFVRNTNFANNEIYIITAHDSPNTMREIGRLRELSFRSAGGGTGQEIDIDNFDTMEFPYKQLIVWNPIDKEIVGGYRFIKLKNIKPDSNGSYNLATTNLLEFSTKFNKDYLPYTIELGRSFVQPKYQSSKNIRKGTFSLDNLWDGLGALIIDNPDIKYFFGKVTLYLSYNQIARDAIFYFLNKFFPDNENLIKPHNPKNYSTNIKVFEDLFTKNTYKENHKILSKFVREQNENIPPLVNAYMNLSPSMKSFGSALNPHFGEVEEFGILVAISDIYISKKNRHINSYIKKNNDN